MSAQEDYIKAHSIALDRMERIRQAIEDLPAPYEVTNYAQVGEVNRVNAMLQEILDVVEQN